MAAFPQLTPDERSYDLGQVPQSEYRGEGGVAVLFRTGTIAVGQRLTLPFSRRPRADIELIWDHFHAQAGETFTLPAEVWCGHSGGDAMADASLVWRYAERPEPERVSAGVYSLSVVLEAVGLTIGATAGASELATGTSGTIEGSTSPTLPARPEPVPDPEPEAPTITDVPSPALELPACVLAFGDGVELRNSSKGLPDTGTLTFGDEVDLVLTVAP